MAVLLLPNLVSFRSKCEVATLCMWPPTKRRDCLRATDHVPTGSVTQRSITLAYNGLHLPHSRTNTATSRKAEHEQRVKARVKSPWFAESFGLCLCFLPSCAMYKDNAVGNVVAETGRDLVFMTTTRLSSLSMPLKGEVRRSTWTVCTAADSEEQQICMTCLFAESVGLWKDDGLVCFLPSWSTSLFEMGLGEEGRFDVAARSEKPKPTCQNHKQQQLPLGSGPSKGAQTRTTRVKVQQVLSKYQKKNQINTKYY